VTAFHFWQLPVALGIVVGALLLIHWLGRRNQRIVDKDTQRWRDMNARDRAQRRTEWEQQHKEEW
jgi:hypothetical protein